MCDTSNITVGTIVMVKVGRNEIEVVVTEITANGWKVKKVGSDREFIVSRIERVIAEPGASEAAPTTEPEEEVDTPNPAPESGGSPEKKLSLLNAALQVLKRSRTPLNTKEILAQRSAPFPDALLLEHRSRVLPAAGHLESQKAHSLDGLSVHVRLP